MGNFCIGADHREDEDEGDSEAAAAALFDSFQPAYESWRPQRRSRRGWLRRSNHRGSGGGSIGDLTALYSSRPSSVRDCIKRMLQFVVENYDNDTKDLEKRNVLFHLHGFSASERTFLVVIDTLLDEVPIDHSLSSSIVAMVICGGCLPTKELLTDFMSLLGLSSPSSSETRQKNALTAVAAFAGRLSGALSDWLATDALLAFVHSRLARLAPTAVSEAGLRPHREPSDPGARAEQLQVALAAALLLQTFMHTFSESERRRLLTRLSSCSAAHHRPSFADLLSELEARFGKAQAGPARQLSCLAATLIDGYLRPAGRLSAWLSDPPAACRAGLWALLSPADSTDAVQIMPSGLEARSDAPGFETAVASCRVSAADAGVVGCCCRWYFEATIVTAGVMQIGWASTDTPLLRDEGLGVGDDAASVGIDGCRCCLWHRGRRDRQRYRWRRWRVGDTIGCLLEFSACQQQQQQQNGRGGGGGGGGGGGWASVRFCLNGSWSSAGSAVRLPAIGTAYRPAASLMTNQQVRFNFGAEPFRYRPPAPASNLLSAPSTLEAASAAAGLSTLSAEDRRLLSLPWPLAVRERRSMLMPSAITSLDEQQAASVSSAAAAPTSICIVCADRPSDVRLMPCGHDGLCAVCPQRLAACPLCRVELTGFETDGD